MGFSQGTIKPPLGPFRMNMQHRFARNLLFAEPFQGRYVASSAADPTVFGATPIWGSVAPRAVTISNSPTYVSARDGIGVQLQSDRYFDFGPDPIPANNVTVCFVRQRTANVGVSGDYYSFHHTVQSPVFNKRCGASVPYQDGTTYWDFGGVSAGTTRLSIAGLTYTIGALERWIFIAGTRGMSIWRNGIKLASHTTANPGRTIDTAASFRVGAGSPNNDTQIVNFFQIVNDQWDDATCRAWSAQPYAHLYEPDWRTWAYVGGSAASASSGGPLVGGRMVQSVLAGGRLVA